MSRYSGLGYPLSYWRTASQIEVDFIIGDHPEVAVEVKGTERAQAYHIKGLAAFSEEYKACRRILVSCDPRPRLSDQRIEIMPWRVFLEELWAGRIVH